MDLFDMVVGGKLAGGGGGGSSITVDELNVTENGTYSASSGHAFSPVNVSVPIPSGYIQPTGTSSITANGIYDITSFASVDVNVSGGGGRDLDTEAAIIMKSLSGVYENSKVTKIAASAFAYSGLTEVSFPNAVYVMASAFQNNSTLRRAFFGSQLSSIYAKAFYMAASISELIILAETPPTVASINAFQYMGEASYSIYVPSVAVETYKSAAVWSDLSSRITAYKG